MMISFVLFATCAIATAVAQYQGYQNQGGFNSFPGQQGFQQQSSGFPSQFPQQQNNYQPSYVQYPSSNSFPQQQSSGSNSGSFSFYPSGSGRSASNDYSSGFNGNFQGAAAPASASDGNDGQYVEDRSGDYIPSLYENRRRRSAF